MSAEDVLSPHEIDDENEKESLPETAFQAPHGGYHVDYARPKFGEQGGGIKQARSTYLWEEDSTPAPPRRTGIPAGLGETPPADSRRRKALPRVHLKRDHETFNLPPNGSEDFPSHVRFERPENDHSTFEPPTTSDEILNAAAQTAEVNKQLEQQRKHRKDYLNNVWQRPHEPPVQPNRPGTAKGTASPSSQMKNPAMLQQQRAAQQAFMHRQQEQAMLAHQQGGLVSPVPLENLNSEQAKQLQAMRDAQKGPFVGLPPHSMQQDPRQTSMDGSPNIPVQSKGMRHVHPGMDGPTSSFPHPLTLKGVPITPAQEQEQAMRINHYASNGRRDGPMMLSGQQIDEPKTYGPLTPAQKEAMRNHGSQQTATTHAHIESAWTQPIDEFDNRSPAIANDRTLCSGHRFTRGELKYTISEDRTTDAFKRRKVHFIALGQPNSRAAKVESPRMREARMAALEQRKMTQMAGGGDNGFGGIDFSKFDAGGGRRPGMESQVSGYAKRPAQLHQAILSGTSATHGIRSSASMFHKM